VADVLLQFRSVRMLIAQNQLEAVTHQVRLSEQPVIVADADGKILLINEAFGRLLKTARPPLTQLEDLPALFADAPEVRRRLHDLVTHLRTWRKEVRIYVSPGETKPLLLRADPILSSPRRAFGFVILLTDLTDRKAMESARRKFQEGIIERHRIAAVRLDSDADLVFQNLLRPIIENAQLAALEITDGVDMARMPRMLESVKSSVTRTAELLEILIWHATRSTKL
jgi:chemotaxis family two-component system sensor kinase Cph1